MAILTELRDPRICNVTVTYVEVSADMRHAKLHVSVMGDAKQQELTLRGLRNSAGFLQHKIAQRIDTRYTPKLKFVLDKGVKNSIEVTRLLGELLPEDDQHEDVSDNDEEIEN
jgi:ribosome-binding factor A